jgi:hypothetical protein
MRSEDVALRLSIVFSVAGFIPLVAGLYEIDQREKSTAGTAHVLPRHESNSHPE